MVSRWEQKQNLALKCPRTLNGLVNNSQKIDFSNFPPVLMSYAAEVLLDPNEAILNKGRFLSLENTSEGQFIKMSMAWSSAARFLSDTPSVLPLESINCSLQNQSIEIKFKQPVGLSMQTLLRRHMSACLPFSEEVIRSYALQILTGMAALERLNFQPTVSLDTIFVSTNFSSDPYGVSFDDELDYTGLLVHGECFLTHYDPIIPTKRRDRSHEHESCPPVVSFAHVLGKLCKLQEHDIDSTNASRSRPNVLYSRELRVLMRACSQENSTLRPTAYHALQWFKRIHAGVVLSSANGVPTVFSIAQTMVSRSPSPVRSPSPSRLVSHPDYPTLLNNQRGLKAYLDSRPDRSLIEDLLETAVARRNREGIAAICNHSRKRHIFATVKPRFGAVVAEETALMAASRVDNSVAVQRILDRSPELLGAIHCGDTSLRIAARRGFFSIVCLLLGELGIHSPAGWTALMSAARHGHDDIVRLLLPEAGAQLQNGMSALMLACKYGHTNCIKELYTAEKDLITTNGQSAADFIEESFYNGAINEITRQRCLEALTGK